MVPHHAGGASPRAPEQSVITQRARRRLIGDDEHAAIMTALTELPWHRPRPIREATTAMNQRPSIRRAPMTRSSRGPWRAGDDEVMEK
jgi:hypothetical protein